ncbi:MAG: F0F1 ATP synthase subunit delta [Alphaproteobacteria bacterium]|nr:MAG: F0F1 ATP synthase subunit delta [Alphaproteobacteria bacterium]
MSKGLTSLSSVDARYARALFALAQEAGIADRIGEELGTLVALADRSGPFATLLRSPLLDRRSQEAGIRKVAEHLALADLTRRFLSVLARNRRLHHLAGIHDRFMALLAAARGEMTAEVRSATPLDDAARRRLEEALGKAFSARIRLRTAIDPDLIGGLIVKVGSVMVDNSLKTKLTRFERAMKGV